MASARDRDRWVRLDAAFHGALELPDAERCGYLDRVCAGDAALRAEVDAMLAVEGPQYALGIERLVPQDDDRATEPDPFIGMRLGAWRIIEPVGRGGMGTVYLADRMDGRYEQRVALKLTRGSSGQPGASARFKAETHILARLSHPNIARLLDAGLTPEGSAYLVMEYVDGAPITTHCDAQRLSIEERLRLFRIVCDATQHAHQALIVHRDLKPSNIFVSRSGEVKLLDFGIAKLLEPDHPLADRTTQAMRALTPAYAAPEQLRGEQVTTAADVYVLGLVLYELLTGARAGHDVGLGDPRAEQPRLPAPSIAVRRRMGAKDAENRAALSDIATARRTSAPRLARRLEGDIDRVVLKALHVEPERRYGSAGQLADDLDRLLDGRPVAAQPDTFAYRTRRFVGRHRVGLTMAAVLCGLVISFAVVAAMQARALAIERDRARLEAVRAERVAVLVTDLFRLAEPAVGRGDTITARELLDQGSRRITMELRSDPATQAALFNALARVYGNLGLHDSALEVLERALDLESGTHVDNPLIRAETLHLLGERHASKNDYATAERQFREALTLRRRAQGPPLELSATLDALGRTLSFTAKYVEARALMEESVDIRRKHQASPPGELVTTLHELGMLMHRSGDIGGAAALFREAVEVGRRISGPSPEKVTSLVRLAGVFASVDREPAKAEPLYREALAMARTIYPADHLEIALCLRELGRNLLDLDRLAEAAPVAREGAAMLHRLFGARHDETVIADRVLAAVLRAQGQLQEAEQLLRTALAQARSLFGDGRPMTFITSRSLASVLEDQRRFDEALELRQQELARTASALGEHDVFVAIGLSGLGQHGLISGRVDLAESYYTRALAVREKIHPPDHWRIAEARGMIGLARLRASRFVEAETDLLSAYETLRARRGTNAAETETARRHLVELYERSNRGEEAQRYRRATR
jgi:eukaryotic-like serine/threonine-protein kinase